MKNYFAWLAKFITVLVVFFCIIPLLFVSTIVALQKVIPQNQIARDDLIAVVELTGMIHSSKEVIELLYEQIENENIKGIVLRINSPGGAVGPSQEIYEAVKRLKHQKPIVASLDSVAASGGLYAALGASKIYSQPGTLTGSIGVLLQIPNLQGISNRLGIDVVTIKSGKLKDVGNSFRDMTDDEREFLQDTVLKVHEDFIQAISDGRSIDRKEVIKFADGRVIIGSDAKRLKLVDEFGDVYQAARAVFEILGTPLDPDTTPKLYYPSDKFRSLRELLRSFATLPQMFNRHLELRYVMY
jgi:protease IV